ncbi:Tim44/TimA family putative adaptor protein [Reyranella sp. CPCC 100927]|uniref:Tim44/TimA family putative adaptor protein n=1 Tax=Reyranella sp. CPCC 100927 TaxID=2599616 RepID=UPI0011B84DD1|nr:Tim44/TimA family putative adaptor protein [Reyranella sp. CPCC 100927]TWT02636.1 Tim44 domain-containing protein [Reyranella sp. CPCC 100927]
MGNIDIILIALVAVFLVLRLRSVLGRRTGNERPPTQQQDPFAPPPSAPPPFPTSEPRRDGGNVVTMPRQPDRPAPTTGGAPVTVSAAATAGIGLIRSADATFEPIGFGTGARGAFEMIVGAFAKGDVATLRTLLDDATFGSFESAIRDRQAKQQTLETNLVGFLSTEIVNAEMEGSRALVTVRFVSEQVNVTRNVDGLPVDGNPNTVERVTDLWTFARDTRSNDPNWLLVRTASE